MLRKVNAAAMGGLVCALVALPAQAKVEFDETTGQQAALEREQMAAEQPHTFCPAMSEFRKTAVKVEYPSANDRLPGYLYKPAGAGPFRALIWNHGSEKEPRAQPELARFYTAQGFVFFAPIRHGHGQAPGDYIVDLQDQARADPKTAAAAPENDIKLHERYNQDVVAAVEWLRAQPFVDAERIAMSGASYGGIQTLLSAEKGLGVRAFVPFAPGAMSFANKSLQARMIKAATGARAPLLLVQAKNDYSTGPSEILAPILARKGAPNGSRLYPEFGTTPSQGHGNFACWSLGITIWGHDVMEFLDAALATPAATPR